MENRVDFKLNLGFLQKQLTDEIDAISVIHIDINYNMDKSDSIELKILREELSELKQRLKVVENTLENSTGKINTMGKNESSLAESDIEINLSFSPKNSIEFRVGEYGMAWLGNIVLLFGIAFLVQYLQNSSGQVLSLLIGFISVAGIYASAYILRKTHSYLSKLFTYNGHFLLYYMTLRLHFFQADPLIQNNTLGLFISLTVVGALFYFSIRRKSQLMTAIVLIMFLVSGIIGNSTRLLLGIATLTSIVSIFLYYRFGWIKIVVAFIFFVYLVYIIWLFNNPFITHELQFRETHEFGIIYLIATWCVFSLPAILPKKENISNEVLIFSLIWNALGFTTLLVLIVFNYLDDNKILIFSMISLFCLIYSFVIQSRSILKISASIYAIYGFIAMSAAIYGIFQLPKAYMLLSIQSLLVVSMALWFRSRFIVIMNTLMYFMLLIFYITDPISHSSTNFSFMLVAFITARVINWKKDRLKLKTELLRNFYLVAGFAMTLIAFRHAMPDSLITVSWISTAIVFFILSHLLKNIKYRWLAIAVLIASAINLVVVDMSNINIDLRILILLLLAVISITVSIIYTKYLIKKKE
ncbi:MAG: hypothetical protein ACQERU_07690 [Bacteroidota bacterium]